MASCCRLCRRKIANIYPVRRSVNLSRIIYPVLTMNRYVCRKMMCFMLTYTRNQYALRSRLNITYMYTIDEATNWV